MWVALFPGMLTDAKPVMYEEPEKTQERGGADGQLLAYADYQPGSRVHLLLGNRDGANTVLKQPRLRIPAFQNAAVAKRNPLQVTVK